MMLVELDLEKMKLKRFNNMEREDIKKLAEAEQKYHLTLDDNP